ncbi:MAG: transcriptional repressor NrdR [Spirochaetales bacterium]|nr:transcriptional repressor NrdR [Spirochaetales bacterium]
MRCPHCGDLEDKVIESRQSAGGGSIRRRRECLKCGFRFTSYERIEEKPLMVVKRDGRREVFDPEKLEKKVQIALEKRPVSQGQIEELVSKVEDDASYKAKASHEVDSKEIGEMVLKQLYEIDRVAYVRFASVYRMFDNVEEFIKEIERLPK